MQSTWIVCASLLASHLAFAAPEGGEIRAGAIAGGSAALGAPRGTNLTIEQLTPKLSIDWRRFNIDANESVTFRQPDRASIALNRVLGGDPTRIFGTLSANGQVFLINPNGVLFAPDAQVSVGGLVASTLTLDDGDFLAGNYRFRATPNNGAVDNFGTLTAAPGGYVALLGNRVLNAGTVTAPQGTIALAAGGEVSLALQGNQLVRFAVDQAALDALVENRQLLRAEGGQVLLSANAREAIARTVVNNTGVIEAKSLTSRNGVIRLEGGPFGTVSTSGRLDTRGATDFANGGEITIHSGDKVVASGEINASAGSEGGNGGFIDTSAPSVNSSGARIIAAAPKGQGGRWLLDPTNITINAAQATTIKGTLDSGTSVTVQTVASGTQPGNITVASNIAKTAGGAATLELKAHNNITLNTGIVISSTSNALNVTLNADQDGNNAGAVLLNLNSAIRTNGGNIVAGGGANPLATAAVGNGTVPSGVRLVGATMDAAGGNISLRGNGLATGNPGRHGVSLEVSGTTASVVQTTGGSITIVGNGGANGGAATTNGNHGVQLTGANTRVTTTTGAISVQGMGGGATTGANSGNYGVYVNSTDARIESTGGNISVTGTGGGGLAGNDINNHGVFVTGTRARIVTGGAGTINVAGTGGGGGGGNDDTNVGVNINGADARIAGQNGSVSVTGTGGTGRNSNNGINITGANARIEATGGTVNVTGTGGNGVATNDGVSMNGTAARIVNTSGNINVAGTGQGSGANNRGIVLVNGAQITTSAASAGAIDIRGVGAGTAAGVVTGAGANLLGAANHSGPITVTSHSASGTDSIQVSATTNVSGTGVVTLQPRDASTTIGLAGGTGVFNLTAAELARIQNGFSDIVIGRNDGTGLIRHGGAVTYQDDLTLRNPGVGSAGIQITGTINMGTNNLTLNSAGPVTQTAAISGNGVRLLGPGTFALGTTSNNFATLAADTVGSLSYFDANGLTIGTVKSTTGVSASGNVLIRSANAAGSDFTLNANVSSTGGAVTLASGEDINYGGGALSAGTGKRWLTYSRSAQLDGGTIQAPGNAKPNFYNSTFTALGTGVVLPATGNHHVYLNQPSLTYTADGQSRPYGDANPAFTGAVSGLANGDTAADAYSGTLGFTSPANATSNVGNYAINGSGLSSDIGYSFLQAPGNATALSVTPRPLSITAASASRPYGDTNAVVTGFSTNVGGLVNGNTLTSVTNTIAPSATVTAPAGSTHNITPSNAVFGSGLAANYAITYVNGALTIDPRTLTVSAANASRPYGDGNPVVTGFSTNVGGLANGDTIGSVTNTIAPSATVTAPAGSNHAVTPSNPQFSTGSASNYAIAFVDGNLSITQRPLSITAADANRPYGDPNPIVTGFSTNVGGLVNGDTIASVTNTIVPTATPTAPAGSTHAITPSNPVFSTGAASNYVISFIDGTLTINARPLIITAADGSRVYGDPNPAITGFSTNPGGLLSGETVGSVTNTIAPSATATAPAGSTHAITPSDPQFLVGNAANYAITFVNGTLTITQRPITVTADPSQSKIYGNADATFTFQVTGGNLVNGDGFSGVLGRAAGENVGAYVLNQGSLTAGGNYQLTFVPDLFVITQRPIQVSADARQGKIYGDADPLLTFTLTGGNLVGSDTLAGSLSRAVGENAGSYAIDRGTLANANYAITFIGGNFVITPRPLTVTADDKTKQEGTANPPFTATLNGFAPGEDINSLIGALGFGTAATLGSPAGDYSIAPSGLASPNYDIRFVEGVLRVTRLEFSGRAQASNSAFMSDGGLQDCQFWYPLGHDDTLCARRDPTTNPAANVLNDFKRRTTQSPPEPAVRVEGTGVRGPASRKP